MDAITTNDKRNCLSYLVAELVSLEYSETELYNGKASKKIKVRLLPWRSEVTSLYEYGQKTPSLNILQRLNDDVLASSWTTN